MDAVTGLLPARVQEAISAVRHPTTIDVAHWTNAAIVTACCFLVIAVFHRTVGVRFKKQYFTCHVFANAIITYCVLESSIQAIINPQTSTAPPVGSAPAAFVQAKHRSLLKRRVRMLNSYP